MSAVQIMGVKFKKDLKTKVGKPVDVMPMIDPSMFAPSVPTSGTGTFQVVGPSLHKRKWFAVVTIQDNVITKVT